MNVSTPGKLQFWRRTLVSAIAVVFVLLSVAAWQKHVEAEGRRAREYYEWLGVFYLDKVGESLSLEGRDFADDALKSLAKLKGLRGVVLRDTRVTDDALSHVAECADLAFVNIEGTRVSAEGALWLRNRLPHCTVYWTPRNEGQ